MAHEWVPSQKPWTPQNQPSLRPLCQVDGGRGNQLQRAAHKVGSYPRFLLMTLMRPFPTLRNMCLQEQRWMGQSQPSHKPKFTP